MRQICIRICDDDDVSSCFDTHAETVVTVQADWQSGCALYSFSYFFVFSITKIVSKNLLKSLSNLEMQMTKESFDRAQLGETSHTVTGRIEFGRYSWYEMSAMHVDGKTTNDQ